MPRRIPSEIPPDVLYPKRQKRLRLIQMLFCLICLGLGLFLMTNPELRAVAVGILAVALGFFLLTSLDILAAVKHRQYTAPAWVGYAFMAAFLFSLGLGVLIAMPYGFTWLMGLLFGATALSFLVDGVLILYDLYKFYKNKVHPEKRRQPSEIIEHHVQTTTITPVYSEPGPRRQSEYQEYQPSQEVFENRIITRVIEPVYTEPPPCARRSVSNSCPSSTANNYQVTTYGGTFPVGGRDEPPLPAPDNLSRVDSRSQQPRTSVPRRSVRPEDYPDSEPCEEPKVYHEVVRVPSVRAQETYPPGSCYDPSEPCGTAQRSVEEERPTVQTGCQCCGVCNRRMIPTQEQVVPFVTHQYDQSPCICGYTHYQASTIVKGAVKQCPFATVEDQQRMIQEQLEQMRETYKYHSCHCHEIDNSPVMKQHSYYRKESPVPSPKSSLLVTEKVASKTTTVEVSDNRAIENEIIMKRQPESADSYATRKLIVRQIASSDGSLQMFPRMTCQPCKCGPLVQCPKEFESEKNVIDMPFELTSEYSIIESHHELTSHKSNLSSKPTVLFKHMKIESSNDTMNHSMYPLYHPKSSDKMIAEPVHRCPCKCTCKKTCPPNKCLRELKGSCGMSLPTDLEKYEPLNERPYHPKDNFSYIAFGRDNSIPGNTRESQPNKMIQRSRDSVFVSKQHLLKKGVSYEDLEGNTSAKRNHGDDEDVKSSSPRRSLKRNYPG